MRLKTTRKAKASPEPQIGTSRRFRWAFPSRSVASRALYWTTACASALTLLATLLLYFSVRGTGEREALATLKAYAVERATRESIRFDTIAGIHAKATEAYADAIRSLQRSDPGQSDAMFDQLFPLYGDGTRRSIDPLFDGLTLAPGDHVRGIGAFISNGDGISREDRLQIVAAFQVVRRFGQGAASDLDNFYFFTPASRLVMYAPERTDRLDFYRHTAPPNFGFAFEEFVQITLPGNNPDAVMRCTSLQRIIYNRAGQTWTTGCMSPVYYEGIYVGAWGTSLLLDKLVNESLESDRDGVDHMIITADGKLIAYRSLTEQGSDRTQRYLDIQKSGNTRLKHIAAFATAVKIGSKVDYLPSVDSYVAVATLKRPDWRFISITPAAHVRKAAVLAALVTFSAGLVLSLSLVLALRYVLRREVVRPLRHLIRTLRRALHGREGNPNLDTLKRLPLARRDEIGLLARGFKYIVETSIPANRPSTEPPGRWFGPDRRRYDPDADRRRMQETDKPVT